MERATTAKAPWAALVGRERHGKRASARKTISRLRAGGYSVDGLLQEALAVADGDALDLIHVATQERIPLARPASDGDICDFRFDPAAFATGRRWIASSEAEVLFFEVGKLEARGLAHWPAVAEALASPELLVVLCVRPDVVFPVADALPDPVAFVELPADDEALEGFSCELIRVLEARRRASSL